MPSSQRISILLLAFLFSMYSSLYIGLSKFTLASQDVCTGVVYDYVSKVGGISCVVLVLYSLVLFANLVMTDYYVSKCSLESYLLMSIFSIMYLFLFTLWGSIVLSSQDCKSTVYYTMSIVFVAMSASGLLITCTGLCSRGKDLLKDDTGGMRGQVQRS